MSAAHDVALTARHRGDMSQPRTVNIFTDPTAYCPCVGDHNPNVVMFERHHIWPKGMGGPDVADNVILLCPTIHGAVHHLLRAWVKADGEPPWDVRRHFGLFARDLAQQGYQRWVDGGRPEITDAHQRPDSTPL